VLHIGPSNSPVVSISGVTIRNGNVTGEGGGIHSHAILTISDSAISGNKASLSGGGIISQGGSITLVGTTVSGNSATIATGGIDNENGAPLTIINSTISGNGGADIGAISDGSLGAVINITNSTITGNTTTGVAPNVGGISQFTGTVTLRNTIVAGNTGKQCIGTITNGGNNIDSGTTCGWGSTNGSMSSTNPLLGPLALNAPGTTRTHALLAGSPAIDGVTFNAPNGAPATDQRGVLRPQGAGYDIGAFEYATGAINIDIDGNGNYDALTDGLLIVRYLFGLNGASLTGGAIGPGATRTTPIEIAQYLDSIKAQLDVDGNGNEDALTDGLMLTRYLFGLRGSSLISGAIGAGATRTTAAEIEAYIQSLLP
jgi:hypothetical protein